MYSVHTYIYIYPRHPSLSSGWFQGIAFSRWSYPQSYPMFGLGPRGRSGEGLGSEPLRFGNDDMA